MITRRAVSARSKYLMWPRRDGCCVAGKLNDFVDCRLLDRDTLRFQAWLKLVSTCLHFSVLAGYLAQNSKTSDGNSDGSATGSLQTPEQISDQRVRHGAVLCGVFGFMLFTGNPH
jgi:hypothetical protein